MTEITPTLNFAGGCREAISMYERAFGGKITCLITYREADDPAYNPLLNEEQRDWIYHAELTVGKQRILMSDHADMELSVCYTNFITIMFDTPEEVRAAYDIMKDGIMKIIYPMEKTHYSLCRVVFVDRFGIRWGLMTEKTE